MNDELKNKQLLSTAELAKLLHLSRIAVFKKIQNGDIKAQKVGRNYVVPIEEYLSIKGTFISEEKKTHIKQIVKQIVKQYGEAFKLLGAE